MKHFLFSYLTMALFFFSAHYCDPPPGPKETGGTAIVKNSGMMYGIVCDGSDGNFAAVNGSGTGCGGTTAR